MCFSKHRLAFQATLRFFPLLLCLLGFAAQAKPQRIIALAPHLVELSYSLGAGERLIGAIDHADYPEQAKQLPSLGNYQYINLEGIVAMQPDLVLIWDQGVQHDLAQRLAKFGIASFVSKTHSLQDLPELLARLGEQLGEQEQGQRLSQQAQQRLDKASTNQHKMAVSTFYQLGGAPLRSISAKSWLNDYLRLCGAQNIVENALSAYPLVSEEAVLKAKPELILLTSSKADSTWAKWPQLPAVANEQVYQVQADRLHRISLRSLDGLEEICDLVETARQGLEKKNPL